jgi:beta-N-acetylhexosaminidase
MHSEKSITRRDVCAGFLLSGVAATLTDCTKQSADPLAPDVGEMLMLGFLGTTPASISAGLLADHVTAGRVGSVLFVKANIGSRSDIASLLKLFSFRAQELPLFAIDHEGGAVQRLTAKQGFTELPRAHEVAQTLSPEQAKQLYGKAAGELAAIGINVNLGPVVDLHDPTNPPIGQFGRAFDADPAKVAAYAEAFIDGFASANILCVPKHFPGHGHSRDDSHFDLPDITSTWSEQELDPYIRLIARDRAKLIMSAHLRLATIEPAPIPTTLSFAATAGLLRDKLHFPGVVITDDLDMLAVRNSLGRRETVIQAMAAGNDLLMIKNVLNFDPSLPQNIVRWVREAIERGVLLEKNIVESANRVRRLKQQIAGGWSKLSGRDLL